MKNYEVYAKDPRQYDLLNNGVSKVGEIGTDEEQLKTLRFELETFVCDGEYAKGLERIMNAYLDALNKPEQQAVWVSGFFGSGKSHLVKMLRYLWVDYKFGDGASARALARLPKDINDLFVELNNRGRQYGGLKAAAGTLGEGSPDNIRLAFLQLIFRANGLPENLAAAKFVLWLRENNLWDKVTSHLKTKKRNPEQEIRNFYVSSHIAEALIACDSTYGSATNAKEALRAQFPVSSSVTIDEALTLIRAIFGKDGKLPCTLIVVDEVQQFIGDKVERAMDVQEIAEHCCTKLDSRVLLVGTGQSALTSTVNLGRLQARFTIKVPLSDADVEKVTRQTVLAKKPERIKDIKEKVIDSNQGEISRHLQNTRLASTLSDEPYYAPDYPLLPVRRRFWEKVLRNVDASGTTAQLRTQLKIVFDAAKETAKDDLGNVVAGDFIYNEIATDLLNTGMLQREYHETISELADKSREGQLKSRLCTLIFLISKLPRQAGADDGVRATAETLADLLVEDLKNDGARLRQEVPALLKELVDAGKLMLVENEYLLQTKEGANWNQDYNRRRGQILSDDSRLNDEREKLLREALDASFRSLNIAQGNSRQPRKLEISLSNTRPAQPDGGLVLWVRHGWAEQEKTIATAAQAAGNTSPMLFGFLPRTAHEELRQSLASMIAAKDTTDNHGTPTTEEAIQAADAIRTRQRAAEQAVNNAIRQVMANSKVFLGGGSEITGLELVDRVEDAAQSALQRLFPQFSEADHSNWPQVFNGAKAGNLGALQSVGYNGEIVQQPVCKQISEFIGAEKKGREVRENFRKAPFGWPQDAIDAALVILTLAGNLRCSVNGQSAEAKTLNVTQIGNAAFNVDIPPLSAMQKLELKALFQKLSITTQTGQESPAAGQFLGKLVGLADGAGGEPPQPEKPGIQAIRELQALSGNAQLLKMHEQRAGLERCIVEWTQLQESMAKRLPRWERLKELCNMATGLAEAQEISISINAVDSSRGLLSDPDPVPPLIQKVLAALRQKLNGLQSTLEVAFEREQSRLESSDVWRKLSAEQRDELIQRFNLQKAAPIKVANEDEIYFTLRENSLANRQNIVDALPQRFQSALEEATRLLMPKAVRVSLPAATITNEEELEAWVGEVRDAVKEQLKKGPVIL
jgi:hypothetical protein